MGKVNEREKTLHELALFRNYVMSVIELAVRNGNDYGRVPNAEIALRTEQILAPQEALIVDLIERK